MSEQYRKQVSPAAPEEENRSDLMIGAILGHLRRAEGLSQTSLADTLGLGRQDIQALEQGAAPVDLAMLKKIGAALNFDPQVFAESIGAFEPLLSRAPDAE